MHWLQCCGNAEGWGGLTLGFAEDGVMGGCVKFSLGEKGGGMIVEWLCGLELGVEVGLPRWEGWDSTG